MRSQLSISLLYFVILQVSDKTKISIEIPINPNVQSLTHGLTNFSSALHIEKKAAYPPITIKLVYDDSLSKAALITLVRTSIVSDFIFACSACTWSLLICLS